MDCADFGLYYLILSYPEEILATKDMRAYVRFGLNKMVNLEKFDKELQDAFAAVIPISHHVELRDGRIINIETFSRCFKMAIMSGGSCTLNWCYASQKGSDNLDWGQVSILLADLIPLTN